MAGCFNLDPNRVLDVMLQVFETRLDLAEDVFIPILTRYIPEYDSICQVGMDDYYINHLLLAVLAGALDLCGRQSDVSQFSNNDAFISSWLIV